MEGDTIHPAVILYTDNGGAGEDVQVTEDMALARSQFTWASGTDGYAYATAEDLDKFDIDWAIVNKDVTLKANIKLDSKADASIGLKVPVKAKVNAKLQLKTGFSFKKGITLKKFDAGVYGGLAFKPEMNLNVGKSLTLPKDKFTKRLISFPAIPRSSWLALSP